MSTFGTLFQVSTFGESHCHSVGCIVQGVPPRMQLAAADIQIQLNRRRPGQSNLTTPRDEKDVVTIMSGTEQNITLGTPIAMFVRNEDQRPKDYGNMADIPRPSHADYTYQQKYGVRASSGGGRASARETIGRVAAGAIAEKWLREAYGVDIVAWVSAVGSVTAPIALETQPITRSDIDATSVRCPDPDSAARMTELIREVQSEHDSIGGVVTCVCRNVPVGLGEPCFDKLEAMLAHAMLSIPATKGFEIGSGFEGTKLKGSQHNDMYTSNSSPTPSSPSPSPSSPSSLSCGPQLLTSTNRSGGIQGGISNGMDIVFRVAFKPPATISQHQSTADFEGKESVLKAEGRHDPCVVPRAVPIVEAMAALVIADAVLIQESRIASARPYAAMGKIGAAAAPQAIPATSATSTTTQ